MPISHQVDPTRHLVLSLATGVLTARIVANSPFGAGARRVLVITPALQASNLGLIAEMIRELGDTLHVVETAAEGYQWLEGSA